MRWLFNVYFIIVAAVSAIAIIVSTLFVSLTLDSVQSQAAAYAQKFENLTSANRENFYDRAISLSEDFEYKDAEDILYRHHYLYGRNGDDRRIFER